MDSCWAVLDSCLKMLQIHKHKRKCKQPSSSSSYSVFWPVLSHSCARCVMRAAMLTPGFASATFFILCLMPPAHAKQANVHRGIQTVVFQPFFERWLHTEQVGKSSSAGSQISNQDLTHCSSGLGSFPFHTWRLWCFLPSFYSATSFNLSF